jgi:hypothetical protein
VGVGLLEAHGAAASDVMAAGEVGSCGGVSSLRTVVHSTGKETTCDVFFFTGAAQAVHCRIEMVLRLGNALTTCGRQAEHGVGAAEGEVVKGDGK